jgi:hypothetical protein
MGTINEFYFQLSSPFGEDHDERAHRLLQSHMRSFHGGSLETIIMSASIPGDGDDGDDGDGNDDNGNDGNDSDISDDSSGSEDPDLRPNRPSCTILSRLEDIHGGLLIASVQCGEISCCLVSLAAGQ